MQLVEPLMGGVTGAEGGTAEVWDRDGAARALYYLDFEGTKAIYSGLDIDLDAWGSAEIYLSLSALVKVRNMAGVLVREFVILGVAHADELDADSFTDDTVGEALDTWEPSAGEPDFEVTLNGAPTELSFISETTFAQMQTVCAVKSFGAVGDGVADDSVAIGKAIAFASRGGGTVLFNAGTYLISSTIVVPGTVTLRGTGPGGTLIIQQSHTARVFSIQSATATAYIRGMTIRYASASADYSQYAVDILSGSRVQFNNVSFGTSAVPFFFAVAVGSGGALDTATEVAIEDCSIYAVRRAYRDFRTDARPDSIPTITRCIIAMIGAQSEGLVAQFYVLTGYAVISSCAFSGAYGGPNNTFGGVYIGPGVAADGALSVAGCSFANPSSGTCLAFDINVTDAGWEFSEDRNAFGGTVEYPRDATFPTAEGFLSYGSLSPRVTRSTNGAAVSVKTRTTVITRTSGGTSSAYSYAAAPGAISRFFCQNSSGGVLSQGFNTFSDDADGLYEDFPNGTATVSMSNGTARLWEYVAYPTTNESGDPLCRHAPIVDGAQVGPLT